MTDDAFEAHLALHGLMRYDRRNARPGVNCVFVDDDQLVEVFRSPHFVHTDKYSNRGLEMAAARAIPGFVEFGCIGAFALYRKKNDVQAPPLVA